MSKQTLYGFAQSLFDHGKSGGIGLYDTAFQNQLMHTFDDGRKQFSDAFHPSTHGRAINWNALRCEHLLLTVERKVKPELVCSDFGKKTWSWKTFIDWLVWFLGGENLPVAFFATIFKNDVLNSFVERFYEFNLMGNIKTEDLSCIAAARTWDLTRLSVIFDRASLNRRWRRRASSALFEIGYHVESILFSVEFDYCLVMDGFASAVKSAASTLADFFPKAARLRLLICFSSSETRSNSSLMRAWQSSTLSGSFVLFSESLVSGRLRK